MLNKRFLLRVILLDYILVLLFCIAVTQATGMLNEGNVDPKAKDEPTLSAEMMKETAPPTITPTPTATTIPTMTPTTSSAPTQTRTRRNTPTEEPTKAPYVFPKPIYTLERASSASTGALPTRSK